jgi:PAS domain S-box-containing protein
MIEKAQKKRLEKRIKELEDELKTCKAQLNSFMNNLPFVSWIKDADDKYAYVNESFLRSIEKPACDVIGKSDKKIFDKKKAQKEAEEDQKIKKTGKKILFTEKDGDKWLEIYKTPVLEGKNKVIGLVGLQRDVSDIRKAVDNLNQERDLLQALMDNFPHTIYFKDKESKFIRINKAQANMLGISDPEEAIGKSDFDYFTPQHAQEALQDEKEILSTGEPLIGKTERIRNHRGEYLWVSATKVAIRDIEGHITGLVGISIDVTEKYIAEQKLREARKKAIESDKLKSAFLANMSHEIRTPMNGIIGFANLLKMGGVDYNQQLEYIGFIEKCGNSLLKLVDDIIDISKIESGQINVRETDVSVNEILTELFTLFDNTRVSDNKKQVEFKMVLPANSNDLHTRTDPFRLKQIISNLLNNALKFTEKGFVEFGYKVNAKEIEFYVKDTGIGIPEDKFELIFDRFAQVLDNEKHNQRGTGLGLAISINLTKMLGGKMWLTSTLGKGSTFYFTIPLKAENQDEKKKLTLSKVSNFEWMGKKLLVVDDEELNWIFIRELMQPTQAQLIWAKNGREAVDIYQYDTNIDLILMDYRMPEMNGFEATKVIRSFDSEIPIIAITSYAQDEARDLIMHAGCNAFLSKPVHNEQLFNTINHFLVN